VLAVEGLVVSKHHVEVHDPLGEILERIHWKNGVDADAAAQGVFIGEERTEEK
jgi:hypothetical protein